MQNGRRESGACFFVPQARRRSHLSEAFPHATQRRETLPPSPLAYASSKSGCRSRTSCCSHLSVEVTSHRVDRFARRRPRALTRELPTARDHRATCVGTTAAARCAGFTRPVADGELATVTFDCVRATSRSILAVDRYGWGRYPPQAYSIVRLIRDLANVPIYCAPQL